MQEEITTEIKVLQIVYAKKTTIKFYSKNMLF